MKKNIQLSILPSIFLIATIIYAVIEIPNFIPSKELVGNRAWGAMAQGFIIIEIFIGITYSLITLAFVWFSKRFRVLIKILNIIIVLTAVLFLLFALEILK